mgnify:CR=1 FL=1|jgi:hypothetical protein
MNTLTKQSVCPCGETKDIVWVEPLRFCMGFEESCYGYSTCTSCDIFQTHYSGSVEGALEFEKAINSQLHKPANVELFD